METAPTLAEIQTALDTLVATRDFEDNVTRPAEALAAQAPSDATTSSVEIDVPDASRVELRDADADGLPRVWIGMVHVRLSAEGAATSDGTMRDTGLGDLDE
jgi:hypothetical protein